MEKIIRFNKGILGFEEYKDYLILEDESNRLYYLQVKEEPRIEFIILSPSLFKLEYSPEINEEYFEEVDATSEDELILYVIVKLAKDENDITVNMQAPILINVSKRLGTQVIVEGEKYQTCEKLKILLGGVLC
ncbi:flagellar assembly protein FliW [Candidatus Epulonipiscium viviparus]|uniref:flagellar assembly protein FliW n=1 Tax=Candidatus Epulonipiscium viviparus TaxID=420336 RepID=UPI00016BFB08|nr:flagellar assembly protein FliW [Candidatus Epulopiscium viviparus]